MGTTARTCPRNVETENTHITDEARGVQSPGEPGEGCAPKRMALTYPGGQPVRQGRGGETEKPSTSSGGKLREETMLFMGSRSGLGTLHSSPYVILSIPTHPSLTAPLSWRLLRTAEPRGALSLRLAPCYVPAGGLGVCGGGIAPRSGRQPWAHSLDSGPPWTLLSR